MSRTPAAATPRPTLVDYFLLLAGAGLSVYLAWITPIWAKPKDTASTFQREIVPTIIPMAMRVTEGIVLMWPLLYGMQRLRGRWESLTAAEWLWVIAWVGIALLTCLGLWARYGPDSLPEFLKEHVAKPLLLWYWAFVPALAGLAVIFALVGMVSRAPSPWTHTFSIALMLWPALPLAVVHACGSSLESFPIFSTTHFSR